LKDQPFPIIVDFIHSTYNFVLENVPSITT